MLIKQSALQNNISVMARYAAEQGYLLAPHGKTTMAPQLFRLQLDAGAWAITVANTDQAEVAFEAGAARVLVANEVVGRPAAESIVEGLAAGGRELDCLVDSVAGVGLLDDNLGRAGIATRLGVFVELGVPGGRTGARDPDQATAVADAVGRSRHLRLVGVEGYEGFLAPDRTPPSLEKVDAYLGQLRELTVSLASRGYFEGEGPILVSAGGSRFFDRVALALGYGADYDGHDVQLVVRSGCYIVHDHGTYAHASPLTSGGAGSLVAALEVWAEVLSVPERGLALVGLGKRDVSYDMGLPVPLWRLSKAGEHLVPFSDGHLDRLDDQHGYLRMGPGEAHLDVGDRVGFGLSHPCTAFDKWRTVLLVSDEYEILEEIRTFFH
jgi:D-serine deaminase-like pyridoxal phosphate-dependent protein